MADHYRCIIANNGLEAWKLLDKNDPQFKDISLILSDIMMPLMDGYELLERIKAHNDWKKTPVIMLTARATEEDKLQALRMGVDDYLIKPFSPDELRARITNLIANYQQRRSFIQANPDLLQSDFPSTASADRIWLKELETITLDALDQKLDINALYLANKMALSDRQLLRRLKALTGLSIKKYIQEAKLQKARHLLEQKTYKTISEVSYSCCFNTPGYFSQLFEKRFGKKAIDYFQDSPLA